MTSESGLFGPIAEQNVAFVVDTSASMYFCLKSVKDILADTLFALSAKTHSYFNVIEFNRNITAWADKCVPCNSETVTAATRWIHTREATPGNRLLEAVLMAFEDHRCEAVYIISNSLPSANKNDIIDNTVRATGGRPVHCIYINSTLSDPSAETLFYNLAWETRGSFRVLEVNDKGRFQQVNVIFDNDERYVRTTNGKVYPRDKYCSAVDHNCAPGVSLSEICLPWQSQASPLWWCGDAPSIVVAPDPPLARYHEARNAMNHKDIYDATFGGLVLPNSGILLIDKKVLARRIEDGYYYLGRVKSEVAHNRFLVQFDGLNAGKYQSTAFEEVWIYDIISFVDAFRHPLLPGDKVLAPVESGRYAPAFVLQGYEQRSDRRSTPCHDKPLIVNHLDGRSETLDPGIAIWIPPKLHERVAFELRLPSDARKALESNVMGPDLHVHHGHPGKTIEYECELETRNGGKTSCEDILVDENDAHYTQKVHDYYRNMYSTWPWWWRMWWQRAPPPPPTRRPPRLIRRTEIVHSPTRIHRHRSTSVERCEHHNKHHFENRETGKICMVHHPPPEEPDIHDEVPEHGHYLRGRRMVSPCKVAYSDDVATQTEVKNDHRINHVTFEDKPVSNEDRPHWRWWGKDEPPNQLGESSYAANLRASSSPSHVHENFHDQMQRAARRREVQQWWEPKQGAQTKTSENTSGFGGYSKNFESFERYYFPPQSSKAQHRKVGSVNFVTRDRHLAEWNTKTEPQPVYPNRENQPQQSRGVNGSLFRLERGLGPSHLFDGNKAAVSQHNAMPTAGAPVLNKTPAAVDHVRSRRAQHAQQKAHNEARQHQNGVGEH